MIGSPSYQWQQSANGTTYNDIGGANQICYGISSVPSNYDGYKFRCKVWSGTCGNSKTSNPATLMVCAPPNIVTQPPAFLSVIENNPASFSISASGTNISCRWQKRVKVTANWDRDTLQNNVNQTLNLPPVALTDDSTCFRCLVTGSCGACTSSVAVLHVFMKAHAIFNMSDSKYGPWSRFASGPVTYTPWFRDSSYGHINQGILHYGDTGIKIDTLTNLRSSDTSALTSLSTWQKTYPTVTKLTTYLCTLMVRDTNMPANRDTIRNTVVVYPASAGSNPLVISGRYLDSTRAELLLRSYSTLKDSVDLAPSPYVSDSGIQIWYRSGFIPPIFDTTIPSVKLKTYSLDSLRARGSQYFDTVTVARDTGYCFMTRILWDSSYGSSTFDSINGCYVLMRDTVRPANNLVISNSAYGTSNTSPWDTVYFRFDSTQKIDTATADSVALWFGLGSDSNPNFLHSNPNTRWWTAAQVVSGALPATKRFTYVDIDSLQFNCDTTWLYCAVLLHGKNKLTSPLVSYKFQIGRPRPMNPIYLSAVANGANGIHLTWTWDINAVSKSSAQGVRIYYRTGSAVPDTFQFDTTIFKEVKPDPGVNDVETWAYGLKGNTRYYFGAQILSNNGLWSRVTLDSRATDSTSDSTTNGVRNTIRIDTPIVFDTTTNQMKISWHVDRMGYTNLSIGISFFLRTMVPKDTLLAKIKPTDFTGIPISPIKINGNDTGSYSINLDQINILYPGTLVFDTTYYVFLWLDKSPQPWSIPTDSSTAACHVPPFVWEFDALEFHGHGRHQLLGERPGAVHGAAVKRRFRIVDGPDPCVHARHHLAQRIHRGRSKHPLSGPAEYRPVLYRPQMRSGQLSYAGCADLPVRH